MENEMSIKDTLIDMKKKISESLDDDLDRIVPECFGKNAFDYSGSVDYDGGLKVIVKLSAEDCDNNLSFTFSNLSRFAAMMGCREVNVITGMDGSYDTQGYGDTWTTLKLVCWGFE
jgi:hypothetical protein